MNKRNSNLPLRPKLLQKNALQRKCFEAIDFVKITKQSLYKTNSPACFLAKRDTPVAATLQRKYFDGIIFVIITKKITKIIVSGNYFVIISARMVIFSCCSFQETKAQKKEQKKRQKQERKRKPKKKDKKEERKTRAKQRDRERESEKGGGQKSLREKERETLKMNQKKCPF